MTRDLRRTPPLVLGCLVLGILPINLGIPHVNSHADEPQSNETQSNEVQSDATKTGVEPVGEIEVVADGFAFTEGPADDGRGGFYFTDIPNNTIHHVDANDQLTAFTKTSRHANGLLVHEQTLYACEMDGQLVAHDIASKTRTVLADQYEGKRFNACNDLDRDESGGIYFTDPLYRAPTPLPQKVQAVYYRDPGGAVTRLTGDIKAPNGIGLSPDGKRLYIAPTGQAAMIVHDVVSPGKLSEGRTFCTLKQPPGRSGTGSDGIAIDVRGNVYFTTNLGIQIYSPEGSMIGLVEFPQQPANVTFAGKDKKSLIVTARSAVYRVRMPIAGK